MTRCSTVDEHQHFGEIYCFHLQGPQMPRVSVAITMLIPTDPQ